MASNNTPQKNFEAIGALFGQLNYMEQELKRLRDNVDTPTQTAINDTLRALSPVRDELWKVDGALARGKGV